VYLVPCCLVGDQDARCHGDFSWKLGERDRESLYGCDLCSLLFGLSFIRLCW
jgi:hypothetical protein